MATGKTASIDEQQQQIQEDLNKMGYDLGNLTTGIPLSDRVFNYTLLCTCQELIDSLETGHTLSCGVENI